MPMIPPEILYYLIGAAVAGVLSAFFLWLYVKLKMLEIYAMVTVWALQKMAEKQGWDMAEELEKLEEEGRRNLPLPLGEMV